MSETERPGATRSDALGVFAIALALLALIGTVVGVGFGMRAIDESKTNVAAAGGGGGGSAAASATVTLKEFSITPKTISLAKGGSLVVKNEGSVPHNLTVVDQNLKTADLNGGQSATLDVSSLPAGTYKVICSVPGHADSGMTGTLEITAGGGGGGTAAGSTTTTSITPDKMDEVSAARTKSFPAKTAGAGAQLLQPKVLADGTKQFDLTADVVQWEVEPGKTVEAWGYNGTVPGPTIKVNDGDHVRINVKNNLKESTTVHFHGIDVPNAMDGVPDITQPQIKPGQSFTYEFVAHGPAVGMYHAHSDSQLQVPMGLAGAFLVGQLPYPAGRTPDQEIPMVLSDAGNIGFGINGKSFPATTPVVAKVGETVLIDYFNEGFQIHPMHLHGVQQTVIAKDGVPLPAPYTGDTIMVAPGERYSVLITPTAAQTGTWVWHCHILTHAERADGFFGMTTALVVK